MREDINFGPAREIESRPIRQKVETGLRQGGAAFPF
jgi:hypothetical protein